MSQIVRTGAVIGNLLAVGSMVSWAMGFPAVEVLLDRWAMLPVMTGRFLVAVLLLVPVWLWVEGRDAARAVPWGRALLVGAIGFGGGAWAILAAQALTDPVTVAIFASTSPLCAVVVDRIWGQGRFGLGFAVGLVCALVGGLVATGVMAGAGVPAAYGWGALCAVISGLTFCWGTVMTVRVMPAASNLSRTATTALGALALFLGLSVGAALIGMEVWPAGGPTAREGAAIVVYGALGFALSQLLWIASADRLGVAVASFHINIAPFYAMLILLALGGAWVWAQAWGALIVGVGAVIAQIRPGRRAG